MLKTTSDREDELQKRMKYQEVLFLILEEDIEERLLNMFLVERLYSACIDELKFYSLVLLKDLGLLVKTKFQKNLLRSMEMISDLKLPKQLLVEVENNVENAGLILQLLMQRKESELFKKMNQFSSFTIKKDQNEAKFQNNLKEGNILIFRTENSIKNRFYSTLRRLESQNKQKENDSETKIQEKRKQEERVEDIDQYIKKERKNQETKNQNDQNQNAQKNQNIQHLDQPQSTLINEDNQEYYQEQKSEIDSEENQFEKELQDNQYENTNDQSQQNLIQQKLKLTNMEQLFQALEHLHESEELDKQIQNDTQKQQNNQFTNQSLKLLQEEASSKFNSMKKVAELRDFNIHGKIQNDQQMFQVPIIQKKQQAQAPHQHPQIQHQSQESCLIGQYPYLNQVPQTQIANIPQQLESDNNKYIQILQQKQAQMYHSQNSPLYSNINQLQHPVNINPEQAKQLQYLQQINNLTQLLQSQQQMQQQLFGQQFQLNPNFNQQQGIQQVHQQVPAAPNGEEQRVLQLLERVCQLENLLSSARKELRNLESNCDMFNQ